MEFHERHYLLQRLRCQEIQTFITVELYARIIYDYKMFIKSVSRQVILFLSVMLFPLVCDAAIYRYVDASGQLHFTNVPTTTQFRFYTGDGGSYQLESLIKHFADKFSLDAALIKAVIKVESDFDPTVVSSKGAQGLMQLMPGTAREIGVSNPMDPSQSIYGGSFYLRKMLDSFDRNLDYALAAYNAGPTTVRKYGGIPPYKETQNYVKRVKHYFDYYRRVKGTY